MTHARTWAFGAAAAVALLIGALLATGSVSSAQTPTDTPVATSTPAATTAPTATTAPADAAGDATPTPAPDKSDDPNCPNMGTHSGPSSTHTRTKASSGA